VRKYFTYRVGACQKKNILFILCLKKSLDTLEGLIYKAHEATQFFRVSFPKRSGMFKNILSRRAAFSQR
jgi:hypothetical protein